MNNSHYTSENQPPPNQPVVRRGGLFNTGIGCRTLVGCGCLILLLLCIGSVFIVVARPPAVWSGVVGFINNRQVLTYEPVITADDAQASIIAQVKSAGQNEILITEEALTAIARERIPQLTKLTVDVEENQLKINWYADQSETPIIGEVILVLDSENNLVVDKLGTPKVTLPRALNDLLQNFVLSLLDSQGTTKGLEGEVSTEAGESGANVLQSLLTSNANFKISKAAFEKDMVKLDVFVNISLF